MSKRKKLENRVRKLNFKLTTELAQNVHDELHKEGVCVSEQLMFLVNQTGSKIQIVNQEYCVDESTGKVVKMFALCLSNDSSQVMVCGEAHEISDELGGIIGQIKSISEDVG